MAVVWIVWNIVRLSKHNYWVIRIWLCVHLVLHSVWWKITNRMTVWHLVSENNLNFLGVVAISDPIRPDVPAAVAKCQSAGIGIKIVTGDTPGTATEIARQIGLWKPEDTERNRITGVAFAELSDEEALDRVMDLKIMSRARPTDNNVWYNCCSRKEPLWL